MTPLRTVYLDLDGTLLGRAASVLHDGDGAFTLLGVRALEACQRAGIEVVLYSGRRRATLVHDARILGIASYVFEAGAGMVIDGETHWLTGGLRPTEEATIFEQIAASGAPAMLLERYGGRLEYHAPWHTDREVSHVFRGHVDVAEVDALLRSLGLAGLRLVDNGAAHVPREALHGIEHPRVYHLLPADASKAHGVAAHMRARGLGPESCLAVGDSREDLAVAAAVGSFWLVANALRGDPSLRAELARTPNARACVEGHGPGVYEAVMTELAERRGGSTSL